MNHNILPKISESELEVMRLLWEWGEPMTVTQIRTEMALRMDWEAATIKTLLSRLYPTKELVCVAPEVPPALKRVLGTYSPEMSILLKRPDDAVLASVAPFTAPFAQQEGKPTFYLCQNGTCSLPFTQDD